jgi:hypothetical protein
MFDQRGARVIHPRASRYFVTTRGAIALLLVGVACADSTAHPPESKG